MGQSTLSNIPDALRPETESLLGEKYKVSRLLGEGGMGAVYEAENTWTRRRVAIKVMRPEFARDAEATQRFLREAQSAAQIDHPNVVSVLDLGRDAASGSLFIVQEFLVGKELRALIDARGALPTEEALALILPVVDGLVAAHALGVVHRDLKPENIFLAEARTGRVVPKLIDFGIAKALRPRENEFRTVIGQAMGTPAYMSPEQARGDARHRRPVGRLVHRRRPVRAAVGAGSLRGRPEPAGGAREGHHPGAPAVGVRRARRRGRPARGRGPRSPARPRRSLP
jgi:serine/threonine protein kinase